MNKKILISLSVVFVILGVLIVGGLMVNQPGQQSSGNDGTDAVDRMDAMVAFYDGKVIKWIIKDLKLASKEDWFYVALGIPVSVFAYIHWFL